MAIFDHTDEPSDSSEYINKVSAIIEWFEDDETAPMDFNPEFAYSMAKKLEECGFLTEPQKRAVDNIIDGFKIEY